MRPPGGRRPAGRCRRRDAGRHASERRPVPLRRRRVRDDPARREPDRRVRGRRTAAPRRREHPVADRPARRHLGRRRLLPGRRPDKGRARVRRRPVALSEQAGDPVRRSRGGPPRSVPLGPRRDRDRADEPARPRGSARDDHQPGRRPARHAARVHLPRRTGPRLARRPPRDRHLHRLPRLPDAGRQRAVGPRLSRGPARRRRRLRRLVEPGRRHADARVRGRRRRPSDVGRPGRRRDRPGVGQLRADVRDARDRGPEPVRSAGLDRPRQRTPVRGGPARRPVRSRSRASRTATC